MAKANKYGAVKTKVDGLTFDSKKEAARYMQLKMLEKGGIIKDLKMQVPYKLSSHGEFICKYISDFTYFNIELGKSVTEDVKSVKTAKLGVYKIKKKMMRAEHKIEIMEV